MRRIVGGSGPIVTFSSDSSVAIWKRFLSGPKDWPTSPLRATTIPAAGDNNSVAPTFAVSVSIASVFSDSVRFSASRFLIRSPTRASAFCGDFFHRAEFTLGLLEFAARAAGVGPSAGSLQTSRNNFALERIHPRLRKLQVALGRLLAILQSFISESGQQLSFEDFLAHFHQERADRALDPRGHADHMLCANFPRQG